MKKRLKKLSNYASQNLRYYLELSSMSKTLIIKGSEIIYSSSIPSWVWYTVILFVGIIIGLVIC